jgi:protein TIF31
MDVNETNRLPSTNLSDSLPTDNTSGLSSLSTSSVSTSLSVSPVSIDSNNKQQQQEQQSDTSDEQQQQQQKENENELILIQDNAFIVKISVPGLDLFDLQVTSMELVQEIHQMLMDKEETCHRTCFSLQLDGVTLDNFSELKTIEGLKEGSIIKLVDGICFKL